LSNSKDSAGVWREACTSKTDNGSSWRAKQSNAHDQVHY
jgi:hypothetical protein